MLETCLRVLRIPFRAHCGDDWFIVSITIQCPPTLTAHEWMHSAGYPIISHFTTKQLSTLGGFNIGGINASGQVPSIGNFGLIDNDTPKDAYTKVSPIYP